MTGEKRWGRALGVPLLALGAVYGALLLEVGARARASFREAEQYRRWAQDPDSHWRDLEARFLKGLQRLAVRRDGGDLSEDGFRLEQDILRARDEMERSDFPAKRAYFAYRDVYSLHAPPETRLTRLARWMAPAAKEAWRAEARRRGVYDRPPLFDPDPGEEGDRRVVFSTRFPKEARAALALLRAAGFGAELVESRRTAGAYSLGYALTVPVGEFWRAHASLKERVAPGHPNIFVEFS